jgi:hypothetical protein
MSRYMCVSVSASACFRASETHHLKEAARTAAPAYAKQLVYEALSGY